MDFSIGRIANARRVGGGLVLVAAILALAAAIGLAGAFAVTRVSTAVIIVAALLLGALFLLIILGRWYLGIVLVFVYAPFEDLVRRIVYFNRQVPHLDPIHLVQEFLVLAVLSGVLLEAIVHRRETASRAGRLQFFSLAVALYFGYLLVQIANPLNGNLLVGAQGFVQLGYYVLFFFVAAQAIRTPDQLQRLVLISVACAGIVGAYGVYQHLHGLTNYDKFELARLELLIGKKSYLYYGTSVRVFSTLGTYSACAGYLCINLLLATYLGLRGRRWGRLIGLVAILPMADCLLYTYSRTCWLGTTVGLVLLVALLRPWRLPQRLVLLAFLLVFGVAIYGALGQLSTTSLAAGNTILQRFGQLTNGQGEASLSQRASELGFIFHYVAQHPLGAGTGANLPGLAGSTGSAKLANTQQDTYYAVLLFEIGYPGLIAFVALALGMLFNGLRNAERARDRTVHELGILLLSVMSVLLFISLGEPYLDMPPSPSYFWLAGGLLMSLAVMDERALLARAAALRREAAAVGAGSRSAEGVSAGRGAP